MTTFEQHPDCWQCILFPGERETDQEFARRLSLNHQWTGGEHTFRAGGRLILPRSGYERWDEPIPVTLGERPTGQCLHGRQLCMTCTAKARAS